MSYKEPTTVADTRDATIARQEAQIAELKNKLVEAQYCAAVANKTLGIVMQLPWWKRIFQNSVWETLWSVINEIGCPDDMHPEDIIKNFDPEVFLEKNQIQARTT